MLKHLQSESIEIKKNRKLNKKIVFKLAIINGNLYATDMLIKQQLMLEVVSDLETNTREFITRNPDHLAQVVSVNTKNNSFIVEISKLAAIKHVENLSIYTRNLKINEKNYSFNALNNNSVILVASSLFQDSKDEDHLKLLSFNGHDTTYTLDIKKSLNNDKSDTITYYELGAKASRLTKPDDYRYIALHGNIKFTDDKHHITAVDQNVINSIKKDMSYYLNIWNAYNEKEKQIAFSSVIDLGKIKVSSSALEKNGVRLFFDKEQFNIIKSKDENYFLFGDEVKLTDLLKSATISDFLKAEKSLSDLPRGSFSKENINPQNQSILMRTDNANFFDNQLIEYACMSLMGDATMFTRRELASRKIMSGSTSLPNMHTWFTKNPVPSPITSNLININHSLLKHSNLTNNQLEAIRIICNTPDIAIIQGPPGTGKTTVINEALVQLNVRKKDNRVRQPNNLVSGFRHETVSNITDKVKVYDLPSIKLGKRKSDTQQDNQLIIKKVIDYTDELLKSLNDKYIDLVDSNEDYNTFSQLKMDYQMYHHTYESTIMILEKVKSLNLFKHHPSVIVEINALIKRFRDYLRYEPLTKPILEFLHKVPKNQEALNDVKEYLFLELDVLISDKLIQEDLQKIKDILSTDSIDFEMLNRCTRKLLVKHQPKHKIFTTTKDKDNVIEYLHNLDNKLHLKRLKMFGGENVALLEYMNSLNENPKLIQETLLDYVRVLGATNQQSVSHAVYHNLPNSTNISFDNVFIDEAATSSPLDLFIPMSLAKDRIVLVGDHKQLPNITNDQIAREIEDSSLTSSQDVKSKIRKELSESLFEHLFVKAKELEKKDGIKRTLTLDTQFRMHPKLGELISKEFYQDEGGLNSVIPALTFKHDYGNLKGKYAHWIDVPWSKNEQYRVDFSRKNTQEAKEISKHILESLKTQSEPISIGIISLYRPQVKEIEQSLKNYRIINDVGLVHDKYPFLTLEYGTVDAFQGKEFDVVYLSIVLTAESSERINSYSRLTNQNLLNVALSRQKKLLIVVGNRSLFDIDKAKQFVSSLVRFKDLVESEDTA